METALPPEATLRSRSRALKSWIEWDADRPDWKPGDCAVRAIAVVMKRPYSEVYQDISAFIGEDPGNGVNSVQIMKYLLRRGFTVYKPGHKEIRRISLNRFDQTEPLMQFEPPDHRIVVFLPGHMTAVINGHIVDTFDPRERSKMREVVAYAVPGRP